MQRLARHAGVECRAAHEQGCGGSSETSCTYRRSVGIGCDFSPTTLWHLSQRLPLLLPVAHSLQPSHSTWPIELIADAQSKMTRAIGRHACQSCRKSKTRCFTDTLERLGKCRKCHMRGTECQWKEISKTRKRVKTNARISELESKLSSLTSVMSNLKQRHSGADSVDRTPKEAPVHRISRARSNEQAYDIVGISDEENGPNSPDADSSAAARDHLRACSIMSEQSNVGSASFSESPRLPVNTRKRLLSCFIDNLLPQYPIIRVPDSTPFEALETSRPYCVNAMVTAACGVSEPALFEAMHQFNVQSLSQSVFVEAKKNIDLLQALIITAVWRYPPPNLESLNISQWVHAACTMAMDLGLGGKSSWQALNQDITEFSQVLTEAMLERYRTMFGVYLTCSRSVLRRVSLSAYTDSISGLPLALVGRGSFLTAPLQLWH